MRQIYHAVLNIVRGGLHPRQVALAVTLGLLAGLVTGWNLCFLAVLVLVVFLNVPVKVFGQAWALGMAISMASTPGTYRLGRHLLEHTPLGNWMAGVHENPWLVMADLDRFTLLGGLVAGLVTCMPVGFVAAKVIGWLQVRYRALQASIENNEKWNGSWLTRMACRCLFGDGTQPLPATAPRLIRPWGLPITFGLVLPLLVFGWLTLPSLTEQGLLATLSTANQAEVNAGDIRLSLNEGLLEITDLQVADPKQLDRDRLRIGFIAAQVRPGPLLRGQIHIDKVLVEDVRGDVARSSRARAYGVRMPNFGSLAGDGSLKSAWDASGFGVQLEEYLSDWQAIRDRLGHLQDLIERIERLAGRTQEDGQPSSQASDSPDLFAMRSERCQFGHPQPKVQIGLVAVKGLSPEWGLGPQCSLEITNLSSSPELTGQPTELAIRAPEAHTEIYGRLNLHLPNARHELRFAASDIPLASFIQSKLPSTTVAIQGGTLGIVGNGWGDSREFELNVALATQQLSVQMAGTRRIAGLSPELWNQGLSQLGEFQSEALLYGRWSSPRLRIDTDQLVRRYKEQLLAAGHQMLAQAIDEQLARGEKLLDETVDAQLARVNSAIDRNVDKFDAAVDANVAKVEQAVDGGVQQVNQAVDNTVAKAEQTVEENAAKAEQFVDNAGERVNQVTQRGQEQAAAIEQQVAATGQRVGDVAAQGQQQVEQAQQQVEQAAAGAEASLAATQSRLENSVNSFVNMPGRITSNAFASDQPQQPSTRGGPPAYQFNPLANGGLRNQLDAWTGQATAPPANVPQAAADLVQPPAGIPANVPPLEYPSGLRPAAAEMPAVQAASPPPAAVGFRQSPAYGAAPSNQPAGNTARGALPGGDLRGDPTFYGNSPYGRYAPPGQSFAPPGQPSLGSANQAVAPAQAGQAPPPAEAPGTFAKIGNFSRGVGQKMKSLVPWGQKPEEEIVPPQEAPPPRTASRPQPPVAPSAEQEAKWYQKLWR